MADISFPRLMISSIGSGGGKTTLTCALLYALVQEGILSCSFKCGPDYIDPMFHYAASGTYSRNLDLYFSSPNQIRAALCQQAEQFDFAVLEGVMGFYDGVSNHEQASSWQIALETQTPVILSVSPHGSSLTLAAVLKGLKEFRSPSLIQGVILNQCSAKLFHLLAPAIQNETGLRVYGYLPVLPECTFQSRYLGLVTAMELENLPDKLKQFAHQLKETVDFPGLIQLASSAPNFVSEPNSFSKETPSIENAPLIAVAKDRAFCFYYEENLEALRRAGGNLVFFTPLEDSALPEGTAGIYLGGGYPELYAQDLSRNISMRTAIKTTYLQNMPILAECGGFLYLQEALSEQDGTVWPMVGALHGHSEPQKEHGRFGYLELRANEDSPYLFHGETIRGHEFHRWDCDKNGSACLARKPSGECWSCMVNRHSCFAGFPHLYFQSNPAFAPRFVEQCRRYREENL